MNSIHIISNRLPFSLHRQQDRFELIPSSGGLATGMKSIYKNFKGNWIGWCGCPDDFISEAEQKQVDQLFRKEQCRTVPLSQEEIHQFYEGFSNKTLWPLFHYFIEYVTFDDRMWQFYESVNRKFADIALETIQPGDTVWIHDYQLLLLPGLIKMAMPEVTIGFFLHIPFPSYEVFRILPWRKELIEGMLGADLIGFHTYDYQRHFFSTVRRLFGYSISFNTIYLKNRIILSDTFPMGIDFNRFHRAAWEVLSRNDEGRSEIRGDENHYFLKSPERKWILSIDRMDYTKGIPNRLKAFALFLEKYPDMIGRVSLVMLTVPSRDEVDHYISLKRHVDELVGMINGKYGTISYLPVWYFYRSLPFENLIELYTSCDVALITPIRDGMNLVAKEYVASRIHQVGVLILSEMAGAAQELGEAMIINPNNLNELADAIAEAVRMPQEIQRERMKEMQNRIKRYHVVKWAEDFVRTTETVRNMQARYRAKSLTPRIEAMIHEEYRLAGSRAIFLDYDGTLVDFKSDPMAARPDQALYNILQELASDAKNEVTLISGRDQATLDSWFSSIPINLIAEHGFWCKRPGRSWKRYATVKLDWKKHIRSKMEQYVDRTPGSFIEEKKYALVWHFRKSEPEQGQLRATELKAELFHTMANLNLEILEGHKVVEVKPAGINKGAAALRLMGQHDFRFILAIGDDWTDEYLFSELPDTSVTLKVGMTNTVARFNIESVEGVRSFLKQLTSVG